MIKSILIAGTPRSGTSLKMLIHCGLLGEHRMIGSKFMGRDEAPAKRDAPPVRTLRPIQEYNKNKRIAERGKNIVKRGLPVSGKWDDGKKDLEEMQDMNPDGFCECAFTVKGFFYSPRLSKLYKKVMDMKESPFIKVVSNGFPQTDPNLISKIIYCLRDPHEVAKSQERLSRQVELPKGEKIHSPDFFITATTQFCRWYVEHGEGIPVLMDDYTELLSDPVKGVKRIADFLGVPAGDAHEVVKQKFYRSKPEDIPHPQWEDADAIYELMRKSDFQGVVDYVDDPTIETRKQHAKYYCHRWGANVTKSLCIKCKSGDPVIIANFIATAKKRKIDWKNEPCAYETGQLNGDEFITIEESIKKNHWNAS
jgi:hypothetical protein